MGEVFFVVLVSAAVSGLISIFIAKQRGISESTGFLLGFFLGPIGILIVAVMARTPDQSASHSRTPKIYGGTRDLRDDGYRIFIVEKYQISKNETLGRFVCQDKLFDDVDSAIEYASHIEERELKEQAEEALIRANETALLGDQTRKSGLMFAGLAVLVIILVKWG